jgi:hypothetical protein
MKTLHPIWTIWLVGWFIPVAPTLEHRASVKSFVSLQFLNLRHSVVLLGRVNSPSQGHYLTQTQNKHRQASIPRVGIETTIPASERAKTVHALDRAATVDNMTLNNSTWLNFSLYMRWRNIITRMYVVFV